MPHEFKLNYDQGAGSFTATLTLKVDTPQNFNYNDTVVVLSSIPHHGRAVHEHEMDGPYSDAAHNTFTFSYAFPNAPQGVYKAVATFFSRRATDTLTAVFRV
jgi:hypothetical protein